MHRKPKGQNRKFSQPGCDVIHQLGFVHIDASNFHFPFLNYSGWKYQTRGFYADQKWLKEITHIRNPTKPCIKANWIGFRQIPIFDCASMIAEGG